MYLVFMALLALSFHWYFINHLRKKKQREFTFVKYVILMREKKRETKKHITI